MKTWKFIALAVGVVTVLLVGGWFLRNTLIERLSNPLLAEYGLTVTDVSLDALATSDASIGYLELHHVNGATVAIDDLSLPIRTSLDGFRQYSATKIVIALPAASDGEPLDFAGLLNQLLGLPLQLPRSAITVGEINAPPYPVIRDLEWRLTDDAQELTARIDTITLTAGLAPTSDTDHLLGVSFSDPVDPGATQSIAVDIRQAAGGVSLHGSGSLDLRRWSPIIALLDLDVVNVESGSATLQFTGEIADDPNQIPFLHATFTPTTAIQMSAGGISDAISSITMHSASPIDVSATVTDFQWSLQQSQASIRVEDRDGNELAVSVRDLSCESGPACSADLTVVGENLALPFAEIGRVEFSATQHIALGEDGAHVLLRPDASLAMSGLVSPDIELARLSAQFTSEAEFDLTGDDWQFDAGSADVAIEHYAVYDGLTVSAALFLDRISVAQADARQSARLDFYASGSSATWNNRRIQLPGAQGRASREGSEVDVNFETDGLYEEARVELSQNLDDGSGNLSLADAALSFDSQALSKRVAPWHLDWDVSAGTIGLGLQAAWQKVNSEWQLTGQASVRLAELAGAWQDTAFAGLSTDVAAEIDTGAGITVQPSTIQVAFVDMGLPFENISADYTLYPDDMAVDVQNLRMSAFGGEITADPFSFSTARVSNNLLVHAESIDLAKLLAVEEFEAIEISGSIGAELPVTIEGKTLTVTGGTLTGDLPGGVIRYLPGIGSAETDVSGLGFATRALSNFEYDALTSEVNYGTNGDLKLQMRLTGRNPNLEGGRPIILNLGVENNVPQMLKSLQAARAVEDILERRLAQ